MSYGFFVDFASEIKPVAYKGTRADKPVLEDDYAWVDLDDSDPDSVLALELMKLDVRTHRFDVPTKSIVELTVEEIDAKEVSNINNDFSILKVSQNPQDRRMRAAFAVMRDLINELRIVALLPPLTKAELKQLIIDKL